MTISTYSDLQTSVASWLHRSDLTAVIPDFILLAEARINGDLDARLQDATATIATAAGTNTVALPSDMIGLRRATVQTDPLRVMSFVSPDQFDASYPFSSNTGIPNYYTVVGSNMLLAPIPDAAYNIALAYKARVPALSSGSPTNWLLATYPHVYLYAVLCESAPYLKDDARIQVWEQKYSEAINTVNSQDWYSGSTLRVRADVS